MNCTCGTAKRLLHVWPRVQRARRPLSPRAGGNPVDELHLRDLHRHQKRAQQRGSRRPRPGTGQPQGELQLRDFHSFRHATLCRGN